jgi:hypothetical protein
MGRKGEWFVCSAYQPYDSKDPPPSKELEELVRYCEEEHLNLIVGCESNVHHAAWGSTDCNGRGEALVEFLDASGLEILNRGNEPTFCNGYRSEVIDITLGVLWTPGQHPELGGFVRALPVGPSAHIIHFTGLSTGASK